MWAIVVVNPRCYWIWYPSISRTRAEAWKEYIGPKETEESAKRIRRSKSAYAVRVTFTAEASSSVLSKS